MKWTVYCNRVLQSYRRVMATKLMYFISWLSCVLPQLSLKILGCAASHVSFVPPACDSVLLIYHSLSALWCLAAEPAMPLWVRTPNNGSLLKFCLKSKWTVTVYSGRDSWALWHLFWLLGSLLCSLHFLLQFSHQ